MAVRWLPWSLASNETSGRIELRRSGETPVPIGIPPVVVPPTDEFLTYDNGEFYDSGKRYS